MNTPKLTSTETLLIKYHKDTMNRLDGVLDKLSDINEALKSLNLHLAYVNGTGSAGDEVPPELEATQQDYRPKRENYENRN